MSTLTHGGGVIPRLFSLGRYAYGLYRTYPRIGVWQAWRVARVLLRFEQQQRQRLTVEPRNGEGDYFTVTERL